MLKVSQISPKLADFIDDLISQQHPENDRTILHKWSQVKDDLSPSLIPKKYHPLKSKLLLGSVILFLGLGVTQIISYLPNKFNTYLLPTEQSNEIKSDKKIS